MKRNAEATIEHLRAAAIREPGSVCSACREDVTVCLAELDRARADAAFLRREKAVAWGIVNGPVVLTFRQKAHEAAMWGATILLWVIALFVLYRFWRMP